MGEELQLDESLKNKVEEAIAVRPYGDAQGIINTPEGSVHHVHVWVVQHDIGQGPGVGSGPTACAAAERG